MAISALVMGFLSILMCCTGVFSVVFGALGIIFALLSRNRLKQMSGIAVGGLTTSICGLVLGILLTAYSYALLNVPALQEQINPMFEQTYGMSFEEFMERMGYTID